MVFLSYEKGVTGHPANKDVVLRIMSMDDKNVRVLVNIVGGSGTINVPSWAPDSHHLAFVSYQMLPAEMKERVRTLLSAKRRYLHGFDEECLSRSRPQLKN